MKKLVAALVAAVLLLGASVPALASSTATIVGISEDLGEKGYYINGKKAIGGYDVGDFEFLERVYAGTEIFMPFHSKYFEWSDEVYRTLSTRVVEQQMITVEMDAGPDNGVISKLEIAEQDGQYGLYIRFTNNYVGVEPLEFSTTVKILVAGHSYDNGTFKVAGSIANTGRYIYSHTTGVSLGRGRMAEAFDDVKNMKFDLGSGVTMTANLNYRDKVYGAATTSATAADKEVMAKHPSIEKVYHLETIGLYGTVRFDTETDYYVYDGKLNYMGTTNDAVQRSDTYYLSTKRI